MKDSANASPTELCQYCGKPFKRLKSHLPHCKAATTGNTKGPAPVQSKIENNKSQTAGKKTKTIKAMLIGKGPGEGEKSKKTTTRNKKETQVKSLLKDHELSPPADTFHVGHNKTTNRNKQMPRAMGLQESAVGNVEYPETGQRNDLEHSMEEHTARVTTAHPLFGTSAKMNQARKQQSVAELSVPILLKLPVNMTSNSNVSTAIEIERVGNTRQSHQAIFQSHGADVSLSAVIGNEALDRWAAGKTIVWEHIKYSLSGKGWPQCLKLHAGDTKTSPISAHFTPVSKLPLDKGTTQGMVSTSAVHRKETECDRTCIGGETGKFYKEGLVNSASRAQDAPSLSTRTVKPDESQGFQWFPELYPSYLSLHLIPERVVQGFAKRRVTATEPQTEALSDVPLASRPLMDTRLGELPSWLAQHRLSAKAFPGAARKGWESYYQKYINVRRGSIGGLTMLLAGYCVLSYAWNYNHIKQDRWRKYH